VLFSSATGVGAALIMMSLQVDFNMSAFIIEVGWFEAAWPGSSQVVVGSNFQLQRAALIQE
jgi:hypothetical protein